MTKFLEKKFFLTKKIKKIKKRLKICLKMKNIIN